MKVDFDAMLKALDGNPIPFDDKGQPTTLKDVCVAPLVNELGNDRESSTGDDKFKRWQLAGRIAKGGVVEISADEVKMLKERIGKGYGAVIVGPAWTLLEALKS